MLFTIFTQSCYWPLTTCWIYFKLLHWIVLFISHPLNNQSSPAVWYSGDLTLHHWLSGYCYILNRCVALKFGRSKSMKNANKGYVVGMGRQLWPLVSAWNRRQANGGVFELAWACKWGETLNGAAVGFAMEGWLGTIHPVTQWRYTSDLNIMQSCLYSIPISYR